MIEVTDLEGDGACAAANDTEWEEAKADVLRAFANMIRVHRRGTADDDTKQRLMAEFEELFASEACRVATEMVSEVVEPIAAQFGATKVSYDRISSDDDDSLILRIEVTTVSPGGLRMVGVYDCDWLCTMDDLTTMTDAKDEFIQSFTAFMSDSPYATDPSDMS